DNAKTALDNAREIGVTAQTLNELEQQVSQTLENLMGILEPPQDDLQIVFSLYTDKKFERALNQATSLREKFPRSPNLHNLLGNINSALNLSASAIESYQRALDIQPDFVDAQYNIGRNYEISGQFDDALASFKRVLEINSSYAKAYYSIGVLLKNKNELDGAITNFQEAVKNEPLFFQAHFALGMVYRDRGDLDASIASYHKALEIKPNNAGVYYNLGTALQNQGKLVESIKRYEQAVKFQPDFAAAHRNIGVVLYEMNRPHDAKNSLLKAVKIQPNYILAYNDLGQVQLAAEELDAAEETFTKALKINSSFADGYFNLGFVHTSRFRLLKDLKSLEIALEFFDKGLKINPNKIEAYIEVGFIFSRQGKSELAEERYKTAIEINPDFVASYGALAHLLFKRGDVYKALDYSKKALNTSLEETRIWNNLTPIMSVIKLLEPQKTSTIIKTFEQKIDSKNQFQLSTLRYRLREESNSFNFLSKTLRSFSEAEDLVIKNPSFIAREATLKKHYPEEIIALVHFGRSGTGLLHSLIDGHPQVSTLPSIYFSEFFDPHSWQEMAAKGWDGLVDYFVAKYEVFFDASVKKGVPSVGSETSCVGETEGMTSLGEKKDQVLSLDRDLFSGALKELMKGYDQIDIFTFFRLIHASYDLALGDSNKKKLMFYHIHNPSFGARLNFSKSAPRAKWITMVRDPIQSCESWLAFDLNDVSVDELDTAYSVVVGKLLTMIFQVTEVTYQQNSSIGLRLEDLKEWPEKTIAALSNWLGIEHHACLFQMTAQGQRWWGDPNSVDHVKDGMDPFGKRSINRPVGSILSEQDQLILKTLFYPFSVRFGYTEKNEKKFNNDLQVIRPLLDQLFDFEKAIMNKSKISVEKFKQLGYYQYLRSGLIGRWNELNTVDSNLNILKKLSIDAD
ncbi:tetratricopeptide repeat protein, partial [bacterium]|nr:tetratricopeptide repeat protein [bacterium]